MIGMEHSIFFVTRNMFAGGAERVIAQLANYFVDNCYSVKIITIADANNYYEINSEVKIISIGKKSNNELKNKILQYSKLRRMVIEEKPEVVLTLPEDIGVYVLASLIGVNIPVYVSERNNPWVMPDVKITRVLRKAVYPFASGIIFQTEMAKSFFSKRIQNKGIVINNPVDSTRIPLLFEGERKKRIVAVGRLASQKNFVLLINAFNIFNQRNEQYTLSIYGDGEKREMLQHRINKLGLQKKIFLEGRRENVLEEIKDASFFVLSSDYEGMPNVLIEAMCMGLPVISTDCPSGGPRELIKSGINGILVPVGDEEAMVEAMERMANEIFANQLGLRAYELRDRLTDKLIFKKWESYLFN